IFRWYRYAWGRFVSEDPFNADSASNLYRYVEDSPLAFIDPLGLQPIRSTPCLIATLPPTGCTARPWQFSQEKVLESSRRTWKLTGGDALPPPALPTPAPPVLQPPEPFRPLPVPGPPRRGGGGAKLGPCKCRYAQTGRVRQYERIAIC